MLKLASCPSSSRSDGIHHEFLKGRPLVDEPLGSLGNVIKEVGQRASVDADLLPTIDVEFLPKSALSPIITNDIRDISGELHRLDELRAF